MLVMRNADGQAGKPPNSPWSLEAINAFFFFFLLFLFHLQKSNMESSSHFGSVSSRAGIPLSSHFSQGPGVPVIILTVDSYFQPHFHFFKAESEV